MNTTQTEQERSHEIIRNEQVRDRGITRKLEVHDLTLVKSRNSIGRDCSSANRKLAMGRASCHYSVISEAHHTRKKAG
jgi:hypothetical protein